MAKVATVNIDTINPATLLPDVGYGIRNLMTLLLANGWTLVSCGTGTAGVRRTTPALSQAEWIAAANTWQIVTRGSVWVTIRRTGATGIDVRFAVTAPTVISGTPATVPDAQVTATNEVTYLSTSITSTTRAHAITFDTDDNAAGIRSFFLVFTDGTNVVRGTVLLSAFANSTYATANPAPYAVAAWGFTGGQSSPFRSGATPWSWWYSPSSVWTTSNSIAVPNNGVATNFATTAPAGVDPWSSKDVAFPVAWVRNTGGTFPGFAGASVHILGAGTYRGYPNTTDLATDARVYVGDGAGSSLIPWPNGVTPL